jgi:UTP--glucose-1-phosphate uridylyltransferase
LEEGVRYAFVVNSDNLGAVMNPSLLGFFSQKGFPFMMEVARRTPADLKGGHLARHRGNGRLLLREIAQCPEKDIAAFQDIDRFRFFNTNTLWLHLPSLQALFEREGIVRLPMIRNPKTLDPRNPSSPEVYQIETAMGAAVHLFEGSGAVQVPASRFYPVKKCNDLLAVRSDCFRLDEAGRLVENPDRTLDRIHIRLDPEYFSRVDLFDDRFPEGPPSLKDCRSLTVKGDVRFEGGVTVRGDATIVHTGPGQAVVPRGSVLEGEMRL